MTIILSRLDLSDEENVRDCEAQFRKAMDAPINRPHQLSEWAWKWGESIIDHLHNPPVSAEDIATAEKEATEFEEDYQHLASAVQDAITEMDGASEMPSEKRQAEYERIAADLDKALNK